MSSTHEPSTTLPRMAPSNRLSFPPSNWRTHSAEWSPSATMKMISLRPKEIPFFSASQILALTSLAHRLGKMHSMMLSVKGLERDCNSLPCSSVKLKYQAIFSASSALTPNNRVKSNTRPSSTIALPVLSLMIVWKTLMPALKCRQFRWALAKKAGIAFSRNLVNFRVKVKLIPSFLLLRELWLWVALTVKKTLLKPRERKNKCRWKLLTSRLKAKTT